MATDAEAAEPQRLDLELVRRGLARSRGQARELVTAGIVVVDGRQVTKASAPVSSRAVIGLQAEPDPWVGRAAYKLLAALAAFGPQGLVVQGRRCLDVGASTGGFTQVLLEAGATRVVALDVGHGQLAVLVADDERVEERSGTNMRDIAGGDLGDPFDVVVADLSFISLRLVLGRIREQLADDGDAVLLVKPQFEVGRERLARTGVVTSHWERRRVVTDVLVDAGRAGLTPRGLVQSPISGAEGNVEYLLWATGGQGAELDPEAVATMVSTATDRRAKDRP
ncbi:MAG: TlyA family RNA methyltransferase [Lapillicoccus sp.]